MQPPIYSGTSNQLTPILGAASGWEDFAMPADWRNDDEYRHFDDLGLSGLAWECLRRNTHYRRDHDLKREGGGVPADWGLRFPGGPTTQRSRRDSLLAPGRSACRGSSFRRTAGRRPQRRRSSRQDC
ncbi:transcriptional regulator domain-containing protein [Hyphomonas sp. CY54-11-8]|uniref:transcriptional regulator domain-containing protein n=1 Tax=Hyphomonas sp. CY54-11-8 TaxID=1280944 RepID=UPI00350F56B4